MKNFKNILKLGMTAFGIIISIGYLFSKSYAQEDKSFLNTPHIIKLPSDNQKYQTRNRKFTGIPSIAISMMGRMWAVWYAEPTAGEDRNNYVVVATSGNAGESWKEVLAIDPDEDGPVRAFDPQIWIDPDGQLWIFWTQAIGHSGSVAGVWSLNTGNPNIHNPEWTKPRRITDGVMMGKPMILSSGEWVLPASTWRLTDKSAKMIVSLDRGKTFHERGAVNVPKEVRNYDEHMIVERKDGVPLDVGSYDIRNWRKYFKRSR